MHSHSVLNSATRDKTLLQQDSSVSSVESNGIAEVAPNVSELDLRGNLLSSWNDVMHTHPPAHPNMLTYAQQPADTVLA